MRTYRKKSQLLIIFLAVGFFIGIIYENVNSVNHMIPTEMFLKSNLQRYVKTEVLSEKYFIYVMRERLLLISCLCLLSCIKWKKVFVAFCLMIFGFFVGIILVSAVLQLGINGILLCFVGCIPQGIFYVMAYGILFVYWFRFPEKQWNRAKLIFIVLMYALGILTEVYVNPILVKWCIKIL